MYTHTRQRKAPGDDAGGSAEAVAVGSLTRTLIQALHLADAWLLETLLAHGVRRARALVRVTVQHYMGYIGGCKHLRDLGDRKVY